MKLRVTRRTHNRRIDGVVVELKPGDVFDGTERELKQFSDRLEDVARYRPEAEVADDDDDESFDELKARAKEMGVNFPPNIGEETLRARVEQAAGNGGL